MLRYKLTQGLVEDLKLLLLNPWEDRESYVMRDAVTMQSCIAYWRMPIVFLLEVTIDHQLLLSFSFPERVESVLASLQALQVFK